MRTAIIATLAAIELTATSAEAQRRCTKGIPCGNSCIAADKVCRAGTSPAPREPAGSPTTTNGLLSQSATARDSALFDWVGSVDGQIYYRATCAMVAKLLPQERAYFRMESDAIARGYTRSRVVGC